MTSLFENTLIRLWPFLRFLLWLSVGTFLGVGYSPVLIGQAEAAEPQSRTESNCTIGMAKGEMKSDCHVPILKGSTVAQFPGYDEPWADISKGGATTCQFDEKRTDWKTSIVGSCQSCKTEQCTGRFTVMFNCSDTVPPANPAMPQRK